MGNRAIITSEADRELGVYVHWNGGRASVEGFLQACKELGYRDPASDPAYAMSRLCFVICSYFCEDELNVGLESGRYSLGDNGIFVIGKEWKIVAREDFTGTEEIDDKKTSEIKTACVELIKNMRQKQKEIFKD